MSPEPERELAGWWGRAITGDALSHIVLFEPRGIGQPKFAAEPDHFRDVPPHIGVAPKRQSDHVEVERVQFVRVRRKLTGHIVNVT
jgi:hypothetical protein